MECACGRNVCGGGMHVVVMLVVYVVEVQSVVGWRGVLAGIIIENGLFLSDGSVIQCNQLGR